MFHSNSALDNIEATNALCWILTTDTEGRSVRFYSSEHFTEVQAGILYRAYVNETVTIVEDHFDYKVGANVIDMVDYGNDVTDEFSVSEAPAFRLVSSDWVEVAGVLNAYLCNCYPNVSPLTTILNSVESVDYNEKTETFTVSSENGSFAFTLEKAPDGVVRMVVKE